MRLDDFHKEAARQAALYLKNPKSYRLRLFWFALFGFLYPVLIAVISLFVAAAAAWGAYRIPTDPFLTVFLIIAVLGLAVTAIVIRAQWISFPKPDGHRLTRQEASKLFELVEEIRDKLDAPRIHSIYLTNDFNMAVIGQPRFGFFGPQENLLIVGLWMMESLSVEEIRSVIAHELGHLSRKHNRLNFWLYRLSRIWAKLVNIDSKQSGGRPNQSILFSPFNNWYGPRFQARSMVLSKAYELEADRFGMEITDKDTVFREHLKIGVGAAALEDVFWPAYFRGAYSNPLPPKDPFEQVVNFLRSLDTQNLLPCIKKAFAQVSMPHETHPSMCERLTALNFKIPQSEEVLPIISGGKSSSPASLLLSEECLFHYRDYYNRALKAIHISQWRVEHKKANEAAKRLDDLHKRSDSAALSQNEQWEMAHLKYIYVDKEENCNEIYNFLKNFPKHPGANYVLGKRFLKENNEQGIRLIENAMRGDSDLIVEGLQALTDFFEKRADHDKLSLIVDRWSEYAKDYKAAQKERSRIRPADELIKADMSEEDRVSIRKVLIHYKPVKEAYIVRKQVSLFTDKPCYLLIVRIKMNFFTLDTGQQQILINCLYSDLSNLPGIQICSMNSLSKAVKNRIRCIDNSLLFPLEQKNK